MFRQFFDTSFTDYRQVRIVVQELPEQSLEDTSSDFEKFSASIFNHKSYSFENLKVEYCYVRKSLTITEAPLNEIQLYRRPFGFIFFTVCHSTEELRIALEEFSKFKQQVKDVYAHLFVRYKNDDDEDDEEYEDEDMPANDKSNNELNDDALSDYTASARPSFSSVVSMDSYPSLSQQLSHKLQETISNDDSISSLSDRVSLTNSFNGMSTLTSSGNHPIDENIDGEDSTGSITINLTQSTDGTAKKSRPTLFRSKTLASTNLFDSFDSDLKRALDRLETNLTKLSLEPKGFDTFVSSIDSQLADIRLMINSEKDCSLLETEVKYSNGLDNDRVYKSVLIQFDTRVMQIIMNHYLKATTIVGQESAKLKLSKKLIEARAFKRKGDCCLLLGITEKANQDYQRAFEALKNQNDALWMAAALEARVAGSYFSTHKPKRHMQKTLSFFRQISLTKKIPMERYLSRSNAPAHLQPKIELALQIYRTSNRALLNKMEFQLELDACLRWCALLQEQLDSNRYRDDIIKYIDQINLLGSYLEQHIDSVYLNTYIAESYETVCYRRKSALYYRSAAFSGLTLLNEQESYHEEIDLFDKLIKQARKGYGIDDNQVIFPLIQKTILNESIQISLKKNDFTTIIEDVHFAIESLLEHMTDPELEALLSFLNASDESIKCSYCSIPRLKSLDLMPLSNQLKVWKTDPKDIFIFHPKRAIPSQQQSLHRKVDFYWVKNEVAQIGLVVENYLPAKMIIDQLEFITENELSTNLVTKYLVPARTTKCLSIECIPKDIGQLRILGLRYHIWSTNQEFRFGDFPKIRQCLCSVDVVDELPMLSVDYILVNETKIELVDKSTIYNAQVHRGEELFLTVGLINESSKCPIDNLDIQVYASSFNMSECIKVSQFDLPIPISERTKLRIDLSEVYNRCLLRQDLSTSMLESLTVELRLKYSNDSSHTNGYYRQTMVEFRFDYISSVILEINDVQSDEDESLYLICGTITNHLSEGVLFQNNIVKPAESSHVLLKQEKIKLNGFSSDLSQLITNVRTKLPMFIHYKTTDSNKQLNLPIDWHCFSNEKIQSHLYDLIQSPYTCRWHIERIVNTLRIHLCVISNYDQLLKLEFLFPLSNDIRYLNSNKIIFDNIEIGKYLTAERTLMFSQGNASDVLVVDISVNNIKWKRLTLTF